MNEELKVAIENNTIYDYISNNYYAMSKEDLRDIIKEYSYFIYTKGFKDKEVLKELEIWKKVNALPKRAYLKSWRDNLLKGNINMNIELNNEEIKLISNALNDRRNLLFKDIEVSISNDLQWLVRELKRQIEVIDNLLENKLT